MVPFSHKARECEPPPTGLGPTEVPESRGLFIGTGGSGAVIRRDHLPALLQVWGGGAIVTEWWKRYENAIMAVVWGAWDSWRP